MVMVASLGAPLERNARARNRCTRHIALLPSATGQSESLANVPGLPLKSMSLRPFGLELAGRLQLTLITSSEGENDMHNLAQDLRFGVRQMLKAPGFAIATILTIALGIGAT